jgi:hypothetical protein
MSRKLSITLKSALLCCCLAATASYGQQSGTAQNNNAPRLRGIYTVRIAPGQTPAMAQDMANLIGTGKTPPLFTFNVQSNRDFNNYTGVMVGHDPFNGGDGQANIPTQLIPLVIVTHTIGTSFNPKTGVISTKPGRTVFDPSTAQNKACLSAPNNIPLTLVEQSPIFHSARFRFGGTDVGFTQYVDAFQRANFWDVIDRNSYHTRLIGHALRPIIIDIPAKEGLALATTALGPPAFCAPLGIVNLDIFDALITKHVLPALRAQGVDTSTFPIFLLSNVVQSFGVPNILNCCALGYHGTTGFPIQTYSPSDFDTTGVFGANTRDTAVLSHEVAEWMDDPYGNNPTPAWGNIGQVSGCQNNLEVGDPLSGTDAPPIVGPNRFTYHLQELAFFSWFFQTPSIGIHGWFSNNGTFLKDAGPPCH